MAGVDAVTELPAALAPWATELAVFPPDLAASLGELVPRLALVVGAMRGRRGARDGDPDGFDGVALRGSYERLLLSEWLLADELPDEFLRRAAAGEHAFLRLAERRPHATRTSVALLDVGPAQLGAPRVAQLALLIVLARRATAAGATFSFAPLQAPAVEPGHDVTPGSVHAWLATRSTREPTGADLDAWRARLAEAKAGAVDDRELWIVGGARAIALATERDTASVRLDELPSLEQPTLGVTVRRAGSPTRDVTLVLPDPHRIVRLLRDPFQAATTAMQPSRGKLAVGTNLVFASNGAKVFARTTNGIVTFPVPNSARAPAGHPKFHVPRQAVAAVGRIGKATAYLTTDPEARQWLVTARGEVLHRLGHFTNEAKVHAPTQPSTAEPLRALHWRRPGQGGPEGGCFVDARGWLFEWTLGEADVSQRLVARDVLATAPIHGGVVFVGRAVESFVADTKMLSPSWVDDACLAGEPGDWVLGTSTSTLRVPLGRRPLEAAHLCARSGAGTFQLLAVRPEGEPWSLWPDKTATPLALPADHRVFGVTSRAESAMVCSLDGTRSHVHVTTRALDAAQERHTVKHERIVSTAAPITAITLSDDGRSVAYLTSAQELAVYSLDRHETLCRFDLSEGS